MIAKCLLFSGSYENEVLTVEFLKKEVSRIEKETSAGKRRLTLDVQKPRGSFNLHFIDGLTHHYREITNVIVKLEAGGNATSPNSLLLNCHFDSVPQSPGGIRVWR